MKFGMRKPTYRSPISRAQILSIEKNEKSCYSWIW